VSLFKLTGIEEIRNAQGNVVSACVETWRHATQRIR